MDRLGDLASAIRSKNAGPFAITVDLFFETDASYDRVRSQLGVTRFAEIYKVEAASVTRYEIPDLLAIKFSFRRPAVQGSRFDRDMHGGQFAVLLGETLVD